MTCRRAINRHQSAGSWENPSADSAPGETATVAAPGAHSWWPGALLALLIGAVAWLVLGFEPHSLSDLGWQMFAVLVVTVSLSPVLLIRSEPSL
jgi:hypothetical protein